METGSLHTARTTIRLCQGFGGFESVTRGGCRAVAFSLAEASAKAGTKVGAKVGAKAGWFHPPLCRH